MVRQRIRRPENAQASQLAKIGRRRKQMRPLGKRFAYTVGCVLALSLPVNILAQNLAQDNDKTPTMGRFQNVDRNQQQTGPSIVLASEATGSWGATSEQQIASSELPDSPGASWSKAQNVSAQQDNSSQSTPPQSTDPGGAQTRNSQAPANQEPTQKPQRPVGTAAAEAPKVNGVTAAQPAGVAIAPGKQRRVRKIVLRVGAMVGAGVALGAVIGLAEATPSKPPGAH